MVRARRSDGKVIRPADGRGRIKTSIKWRSKRSYRQPDQADGGKSRYTNQGLDTLRTEGDATTTEVDFVV
jgi:hypothetical protein